MANYNRKCLLCGEEYEYCPSCSKDLNKPIWYRNFNEENCRTIFYILSDYVAGNLDKKNAKAKLKECDLSKKNSWSDKNQELLKEILSK